MMMERAGLSLWQKIKGTALVYFILARLSLFLAFEGSNASPVWPPTGLALAAVFTYGIRLWPGILIGAFAANLFTFLSNGLSPATALPLSLVIGGGNTLEALAGFFLVRKFIRGRHPFLTVANVIKFIFLGAMVSTLISAGIGIAGLLAAKIIAAGQAVYIWLTWWSGDAYGALIITPFLLAWFAHDREKWSLFKSTEFIFMTALLLAYLNFTFGSSSQLDANALVRYEYMIIAILLLATFRLGQRGATASLLLSSFIATWYTVKGRGPFALETANDSLLSLFSFLSFIALTILLLSALLRERSNVEEEIKAGESFLNSVIEHIPNMIFVKDSANLRFLRFNRAGEELLGYSRETLMGKNDYDFFSDEEAASFIAMDQEVLKARQLIDIPEETVQTRNRGIRTLHTKKIPVLDEHGNPLFLLGISEDITEQKQAQKEKEQLELILHQSQKMEAMGTLAGGIAHDFNNILTALYGFTDLAVKNSAGNDKALTVLDQIRQGHHRAAHLVKQILAFSRKEKIEPQHVELNRLIEDFAKMLRRVIGEDIELAIQLCDEDITLFADPGQLEQIVMNLVINARDALRQLSVPGRTGTITISTDIRHIESDLPVLLFTAAKGSYARLVIRDNGPGIPRDLQVKIFDPFYTTKEEGKGTGLGLSTVYGIVKQNHGFINVNSNPGAGAEFSILWPLCIDSECTNDSDASQPELPGGHGEHILLAEDEDTLRELEKKYLESYNYRVSDAGDGLEALKIFDKGKIPFDLLITDVTMPRMGGIELVREIWNYFPHIKIILTTGYIDNIKQFEKELSDTVILYKPFEYRELLTTIAELLNPES